MLGETIEVITPGTDADPYAGTDAVEGSEREVTTVAPPEPRPSAEPTQDARNAVTSGWTLYLPSGDPISRTDEVRVRGEVYPVQGQPADWGVGVVVQAFRTEG